jgi:hypothetical protein
MMLVFQTKSILYDLVPALRPMHVLPHGAIRAIDETATSPPVERADNYRSLTNGAYRNGHSFCSQGRRYELDRSFMLAVAGSEVKPSCTARAAA